MDALKRFNKHIESGNAPAALSKFVSKKDGSAITSMDEVNGQPGWFRIHSDKHAYDFFYDVIADETHIGSKTGDLLPWGVSIPPEQYQGRDTNAEKIATTGHIWSSHEQMASLLETSRSLATSDQREAAMADLALRTQQMADRIRLSRPAESAAQLQIGGTPTIEPGAFTIKDANEYPETVEPSGYALAHSSSLGNYNRRGLEEFGPQITEGEERPVEPAKSLVGSLAFNAMVNVPGMRHATILPEQAPHQEGNIRIDDSYGDGSQVHYRTAPGEGGQLKVLGFDVVVPHLIGAKDEDGNPVAQEHTYRRNQQLREDTHGNTHITHMSHMMAMTGPDGQDYVSDPFDHEIGERSAHNKADTGQVRDSLAMEVAKAKGEFETYDEQQRHLNGMANLILEGEYATEPTEKGGLRAKYRKDGGLKDWMDRITNGPPIMRQMLMDQLRGHMGAQPGAVNADLPERLRPFVNDPKSVDPKDIGDMLDSIGFARAQQQITSVTSTKDRLLEKYGSKIHPDNFGKNAKGFQYDHALEPGTPHHQNYVTNEYGRMLGMARQLLGNPGKWGEAVEDAADFLGQHMQKFPTEPGPDGGRNWFAGIRNSVRAKANPKIEPEKVTVATGKAWEVLPHDTPIEQLHGGTYTVRHRSQGEDISTTQPLNEQEHAAVFGATTLGELHTALNNMTVENPGGGGRKGSAPKWAKLHVTIPGRDQSTVVRMGPQKGTQERAFRVDPGEASRQSAVSWAVYHPPTDSVAKAQRGIVATFPSRSAAVAHAQERQAAGEEPGHVLIPLHKGSNFPIDDPRPAEDLPRSAHPQQVDGKTVREVPWGKAGQKFHEAGVWAIRRSRGERAKALQEAGPMTGGNQPVSNVSVARSLVTAARSFTRPPVDTKGQVTKSFSPVR